MITATLANIKATQVKGEMKYSADREQSSHAAPNVKQRPYLIKLDITLAINSRPSPIVSLRH